MGRLSSGFRLRLARAARSYEKVPLNWDNRTCLGSCPPSAEGTFQVKNSARTARVTVSADGRGLSDGLARWRAPRAVHDPGKIIADLAAAVALGGDCLADIAVLRDQPGLAGPVASDPVVSRLVSVLAGDLPRALRAIRAARASARERAWALAGGAAPGADGGLVTVDLAATIAIAHSEKQQASPTWKKTFGFHPVSPWPSCCAPGTPSLTPPPTISRPPGSRSPSCPATCGAKCWSGPIPAAG